MEFPPRPPTTTPSNDPYADRAAIRARVEKKHKAWTGGQTRAGFLQAAKGNLLYRHGHHWIRPVGNAYGDWRPALVKKGTPMPVYNLFAAIMKTFTSMLARFEPALTFRPATDEPEDRATADVASRALDVVQDECQMTVIRQLLGEWVGMTGGAWLETGWDVSMTHGVVNLPMEGCLTCGSTQPVAPAARCQQPGCGGPTMERPGVTQPMPRGKLFVEVRSLFEMIFDLHVTDPTKHRILICQKSFDVDDAKARWTGRVDPERIHADSVGSNTSLTQDSLAVMTPALGDLHLGSARVMWQTQGPATNTRVTETWYWELPSEEYPEGLLAIYLGKSFEQCALAGPLPYYAQGADGSREPFLPFVFFPQELVPGSAWPRTVANDVRPKNAQRNLWESLIIMAGQRMANPVWLSPRNANLSTPTGEPGQFIEYNALPIGGALAKPERIPGLPINQSWLLNLERIDKEIQELTAIFEVLSGNRPEGISAGIALQILKERGESRFGPMFQLWHHAWAQWAKQALEIFRMFATEERMLRLKGRDGEWEVQKFLGADLRGRIDVVPEAGMSMPKSTMTDRATMEQLQTMGVINPAGNIEHQLAVLREWGMLHVFMPGMDNEIKSAIIENEQFEALAQAPGLQGDGMAVRQMAQTAPSPLAALGLVEQQLVALGMALPAKVRPSIDDHGIHGREHRDFARSELFRKLPDAVQAIIELHIAAHDFLAGQQMQMALAARQGLNPAQGFLARPMPARSPETSSSSGQRMEGDFRESEDRMSQVG